MVVFLLELLHEDCSAEPEPTLKFSKFFLTFAEYIQEIGFLFQVLQPWHLGFFKTVVSEFYLPIPTDKITEIAAFETRTNG